MRAIPAGRLRFPRRRFGKGAVEGAAGAVTAVGAAVADYRVGGVQLHVVNIFLHGRLALLPLAPLHLGPAARFVYVYSGADNQCGAGTQANLSLSRSPSPSSLSPPHTPQPKEQTRITG